MATRTVTCYACSHKVDPIDGQCAFCKHRLCERHTIRTTFYGDWVSWCSPCHTQYEADQAAHRNGMGLVWWMIEETKEV